MWFYGELVLNFLMRRRLLASFVSPIIGQPEFHIASVEADDTLFHMAIVDDPTFDIAVIAAMKIRASISPYSTAVAALVDRSNLAILVIVLPLPFARFRTPELPDGSSMAPDVRAMRHWSVPVIASWVRDDKIVRTSAVQFGDSGPRVPEDSGFRISGLIICPLPHR